MSRQKCLIMFVPLILSNLVALGTVKHNFKTIITSWILGSKIKSNWLQQYLANEVKIERVSKHWEFEFSARSPFGGRPPAKLLTVRQRSLPMCTCFKIRMIKQVQMLTKILQFLLMVTRTVGQTTCYECNNCWEENQEMFQVFEISFY